MAPEILRAGPNEPYPLSVDVYSVGVVAYTLLCGFEPFYGETDAALIAANKAGVFDFHIADWCNISLAAQELVGALMDPDPAKRPTALQVYTYMYQYMMCSGCRFQPLSVVYAYMLCSVCSVCMRAHVHGCLYAYIQLACILTVCV